MRFCLYLNDVDLLLNCGNNVLLALLVDVSLYLYFVSHGLVPRFILTFEHLSLLVLHFLFLVPVDESCLLPLVFQLDCVLFFQIKDLVFLGVSEDSVLFELLLDHLLDDSVMGELLL